MIKTKQRINKEYEINGVSTYAHCFCFYIKAKNKKEAKEKAKKELHKYNDPATAEFQSSLVDEPIEL